MRVRNCLVSAMIVVVVSVGSLRAEDAPPPASVRFEKILSEWKAMLTELLTLQTEFDVIERFPLLENRGTELFELGTICVYRFRRNLHAIQILARYAGLLRIVS